MNEFFIFLIIISILLILCNVTEGFSVGGDEASAWECKMHEYNSEWMRIKQTAETESIIVYAGATQDCGNDAQCKHTLKMLEKEICGLIDDKSKCNNAANDTCKWIKENQECKDTDKEKETKAYKDRDNKNGSDGYTFNECKSECGKGDYNYMTFGYTGGSGRDDDYGRCYCSKTCDAESSSHDYNVYFIDNKAEIDSPKGSPTGSPTDSSPNKCDNLDTACYDYDCIKKSKPLKDRCESDIWKNEDCTAQTGSHANENLFRSYNCEQILEQAKTATNDKSVAGQFLKNMFFCNHNSEGKTAYNSEGETTQLHHLMNNCESPTDPGASPTDPGASPTTPAPTTPAPTTPAPTTPAPPSLYSSKECLKTIQENVCDGSKGASVANCIQCYNLHQTNQSCKSDKHVDYYCHPENNTSIKEIRQEINQETKHLAEYKKHQAKKAAKAAKVKKQSDTETSELLKKAEKTIKDQIQNSQCKDFN